MEKFFALQKVEERTGAVYGVCTAEETDKSGEIFDYSGGGKAAVQKWSDETAASTRASGVEVSLGNIRLMHNTQIAGKVTRIDYDDNAKTIGLLTQPVSDEIRSMCLNGFVRGYSIAGRYRSRNCNRCGTDMLNLGNDCPVCGTKVVVRFVPVVAECSFVDNPCVASATFQYVRADGSTELRKFAPSNGGPGSNMNLTSRFHKAMAKSHSNLAAANNQLAGSAASRADFTSEKSFKAIAAEHESIAAAHTAHSAALSAAGDTDDTGKVVKSFFDEFMYGSRQSPSGGLFDPNDTGALFK